MLAEDYAPIAWQKSSHSANGTGGDCCEVACLATEVLIRDSKLPDRSVLRFSLPAWLTAVAYFGSAQSAGGIDEQL